MSNFNVCRVNRQTDGPVHVPPHAAGTVTTALLMAPRQPEVTAAMLLVDVEDIMSGVGAAKRM